jgi:hypothetical protein
MRIAQSLALRLTELSGFPGLDPHDRVFTRNVRELELINTGFAALGSLV